MTRMRSDFPEPGPSGLALSRPAGAWLSGTRTVSSDPWPSPGLLAQALPPWSSISPLTSARPRPSPPRLRSMLWSAWLNGSNSRRNTLASLPMPVPPTARTASSPDGHEAQPRQVRHLAGAHVARLRPLRRGVAEQLQDLNGIADGGERVAELVGEHGQKLVLAPVRLAQRLLGALPLRDVAGGPLYANGPTV